MADEETKPGESAPKSAPPQAPPPIVTQVHKREGRQWPLLAVYIILALVVALGVVFGGRWIYHKVHHKSATVQPAPASNKVPKPPSTTPSQSGASPNTQSNTQKKPSNSNTSTSSSNQSNQSSRQITNTGPGDVIAIFIGTSAIAAALHYIISLRKLT